MKIKTNHSYGCIPALLEFELPNFTVLVGENGSGKTHLFRAMSDKHYSFVTNSGNGLLNIVNIPFNGLNPEIDGSSNSNQISQSIQRIWEKVIDAQQHSNASAFNLEDYDLEKDPIYIKALSREVKKFLKIWYEKYGIIPSQIKEENVHEFVGLVNLPQDNLLSGKFAQLFKGYANLQFDNRLNRFYQEQGYYSDEEEKKIFTEEEFITKFGSPPWNLVNDILNQLELPYHVKPPQN